VGMMQAAGIMGGSRVEFIGASVAPLPLVEFVEASIDVPAGAAIGDTLVYTHCAEEGFEYADTFDPQASGFALYGTYNGGRAAVYTQEVISLPLFGDIVIALAEAGVKGGVSLSLWRELSDLAPVSSAVGTKDSPSVTMPRAGFLLTVIGGANQVGGTVGIPAGTTAGATAYTDDNSLSGIAYERVSGGSTGSRTWTTTASATGLAVLTLSMT